MKQTQIFLLLFLLIPFQNAIAINCEGFDGDNKMCLKMEEIKDKNIYGEDLGLCSLDPLTGFYRNGYCQTGENDIGIHVACAQVTDEFLKFSKSRGNDLITERPEFNFPGLKAGDKWCLCAARWMEAEEAGVAPLLNLDATHKKMLEFAPIELLEKHKIK